VDAATVLQIVLLVAATAVCGFVIWAVFELVATARSTRKLADDLDASLMPLLAKADVTVDALNIELLRIDEIVTRVEEVTDRVNSTSRTVQEVANAPAEIVNEIAVRVRKAFKSRKHAQSSPAAESAPEAAATSDSSTSPAE
jgi:uncharacterized protein YoxC